VVLLVWIGGLPSIFGVATTFYFILLYMFSLHIFVFHCKHFAEYIFQIINWNIVVFLFAIR